MATINGIALQNFTFGDRVYQAGDKVIGVPYRFEQIGLVRVANVENAKDKNMVLMHEDSSDVEVVKEEKPILDTAKKSDIKPIKKIKK